MIERPRAAHFLLELLIAIAVFAVCAAICIWIFFEAFSTAADARDLNHALIASRNAAEMSKAYGSPQDKMIFYDNDWHSCDESEAAFVLSFTQLDDFAESILYELKVCKINGEEIIAFPLNIRGEKYE